MATIESSTKIFSKETKEYQKLSLKSLKTSIDLLKSIDESIKKFTKDFEEFSSRNLKNIVSKNSVGVFRKLIKPMLSLIDKGFKGLYKFYQTDFIQFFKGLIVQSYREFRDALKPITNRLSGIIKQGVEQGKKLLDAGLKAGRNFAETTKNRFLESGPGKFLNKKLGQFTEVVGILKDDAIGQFRKIKKFSDKGLHTENPFNALRSTDTQKDKDGIWRDSKGRFAKKPEKKSEISTLNNINETLQKTLNFWKRLVDKSDDPGSEDEKSSFLSKIFKKKDTGSAKSSSGSKGSGSSKAAKLGGKLGGFLGGMIGSTLGNAIAGFVMALGNPGMIKSSAMFAVVLPLIGAGIGGFITAIGLIGKFGIEALFNTLPKLSESLITFESLNEEKLSRVGTGIGNFFKSFSGGALGGILSNFTLPDPKLLGDFGKSLKNFETLNAQNIANSSVAIGNILQSLEKSKGFDFEQEDIEKLVNFSKVLSSMDKNLNGENLKTIGEGLKPIVDNTQNLGNIKYNVNEDGELGPLGQLGKDLSQFKEVNIDNIKNVGPAIASLGNAFKDTKLGELFGTINNIISGFFGGEKSLSDQLNEMATGLSAFNKLDADKMQKIGPAIKSLGQGLKDSSEGLEVGLLSKIFSIFGSEDQGKSLVDKFKTLSELGEEGVAKRLTAAGLALQKFALGLQTVGRTSFDNVADGLEKIIGKIRPLIRSMKDANFSPEDTLQGVAEGMKMFENITVPNKSVEIESFLTAIGNGLKTWDFDESIVKTLTSLKNQNILDHIASNAPKFSTFAEMSSTGLETNFKALGKGLEELSDFLNDGEIKTLEQLSKSGIIQKLAKLFRPDSTVINAKASVNNYVNSMSGTDQAVLSGSSQISFNVRPRTLGNNQQSPNVIALGGGTQNNNNVTNNYYTKGPMPDAIVGMTGAVTYPSNF